MASSRRGLQAVDPTHGRAILYVRVSALMGRTGPEFHSPDLQIDSMRRMLTPTGLREVGVVQDIDVSGTTFTREGLDKIRKLAEARQIDVVAVYDYSRLGRNVAEAAALIKWLAERGVRVMSSNEPVDHDTPEGKLMLNQFLGMAQFYSDQMSRRWSDVLARRARVEGLSHGVVHTGYVRDGRDVIAHPILGPVVTEVIRRYAEGESTVVLAAHLGVMRGKSIAASQVRKICTSPYYLGQVRSRGEWFAGAHEPLTDPVTHERALRRAQRDSKTHPRLRRPSRSISGLAWCGHCESRAHLTTRGERGQPRVSILLCAGQRQMWPKICDGFGNPTLDRIEEKVLEQVRQKIASLRSDPSTRIARHGERARLKSQRAQLEQELARIASAMGRLTVSWAREQISEAVFADALADLKQSESAVAQALGEVDVPEDVPDAAEVVRLAEELLDLWPDLTGPERNRALVTVVKRIVVSRGDFGNQRVEVVFV